LKGKVHKYSATIAVHAPIVGTNRPQLKPALTDFALQLCSSTKPRSAV